MKKNYDRKKSADSKWAQTWNTEWQSNGKVDGQMNARRRMTVSNDLKNQKREYGQGQNRTADSRIFSPLAVSRLCNTIGRYMCLFERLTRLRSATLPMRANSVI